MIELTINNAIKSLSRFDVSFLILSIVLIVLEAPNYNV